jgi:HPt (histidine-containing phosphotransfer) domain-containing protein
MVQSAHSLKGSAANLCAEPVREAADRLEQLGREGDFEQADVVLKDLENAFDDLQNFCQSLFLEDTPV